MPRTLLLEQLRHLRQRRQYVLPRLCLSLLEPRPTPKTYQQLLARMVSGYWEMLHRSPRQRISLPRRRRLHSSRARLKTRSLIRESPRPSVSAPARPLLNPRTQLFSHPIAVHIHRSLRPHSHRRSRPSRHYEVLLALSVRSSDSRRHVSGKRAARQQ